MLRHRFVIFYTIIVALSACGESGDKLPISEANDEEKPLLVVGRIASTPVEISHSEVTHVLDSFNPDPNLNTKNNATSQTNPSFGEIPALSCASSGDVAGGLQYHDEAETDFQTTAALTGIEANTKTLITVLSNETDAIEISYSGSVNTRPPASGGGESWSAGYVGSAQSRLQLENGHLIINLNNKTNGPMKLMIDWQFDAIANATTAVNSNSFVDAKWHAIATLDKAYKCNNDNSEVSELFNYEGFASDNNGDQVVENSGNTELNIAPGRHQLTMALDLLASAEVSADEAYETFASLEGRIKFELVSQ